MIRRLGAVVPCYNEGPRLPEVLAQLRRLGVLVVVVDDGSEDGSGDIAKSYGANVIRNSINLGYTASVLRGFETFLESDVHQIITIDGDAAHDAADLEPFLQRNEDFSMAIGDRFLSGALKGFETKELVNKFGCRVFFEAIGYAPPRNFSDVTSGLRVFSRDFAAHLVLVAKSSTRFGLCYFSLRECIVNDLKLARFSAGVCYDSRRVLHTKVDELENFLDEMLAFAGSRSLSFDLQRLRRKVSRRDGFLFCIGCEYYSAGWISELGGYIFQRCSPKYLLLSEREAIFQL